MNLDYEKYKELQYCDNKDCEYFNKVNPSNIGWNSRKHHQVYCKSCKNIWVITKDTFFYHLKTDIRVVLECLVSLAEGMGVNAVCRIKGVTDYALRDWINKASKHVDEVGLYLKQDMELTQCQIDEFWSFIYKKKEI